MSEPRSQVVPAGPCLLTVTWSADKAHFELLRKSLERSALDVLPHVAVVQDEDLHLFREFAGPGLSLLSTAEVLPPEVEAQRLRARRLQERAGRHLTRLAGSISRGLTYPEWPSYTGWHTQQLVKLAFCADSPFANVVVLDSDVIVTRHADLRDFDSDRDVLCFRRPVKASELTGKVAKWNQQAHALFGLPYDPDTVAEAYFDTPFIFHAESVRGMCSLLEERHDQSWWRVLLNQPVRRWSEFATYRAYLRQHVPEENIEWRGSDRMRYVFDISDPDAVQGDLALNLDNPDIHFLTLHSQSSGRRLWQAEDFLPLVHPLLD